MWEVALPKVSVLQGHPLVFFPESLGNPCTNTAPGLLGVCAIAKFSQKGRKIGLLTVLFYTNGHSCHYSGLCLQRKLYSWAA